TIDANNITGGSVQGGLDSSDAGNDFVVVNAAGNVSLTGTVGSLDGTTITAGGDLDIGTIQNTDNVLLTAAGTAVVDTIDTTVGSATVTGTSVTLNNGDINANLTLNATAGDIAGNGTITLDGFINFDATGDIGFGSITTGTGFDIDIAGDVTFAEANTRSGNITIDANNITGGSVRGGLDGSDAGNDFIVLNAAGNIALTGTVGSLDGTTINAGGDLNIGTVQNTDAVLLTATGAAAVDTLNTTVGSATVTGTSVTLNNGDINANLTLNATAGDVAGNGIITLGGFANFDATDSIDIGNITANTIDFDAGQNIFFDSLTSPNAVSLTTTNGTIGRSAGAGDLTSGGAIDLNGTATDVGTLDAATTITVTATGAAMVDNAISATTTSITGGSVTLNSGTIGTDLTLNATDGDIDGNGTVIVAGFIDLDATGNIGFGDLDAQGGNFTANAGGDIVFNTAMASGDLNFNAGGQITGNSVTLDAATGRVDLTGNQGIRIATVSASTADLVANTGDIFVDTDLAVANGATANGNNVRLRATGNLEVSAVANTGDIDIVVQGDLVANQITAPGNIVLSSLGSSVTAGGAGTSEQITSSNGSIAISAETDAIINNLTRAADELTIVAGSLIDIQALASGTSITTTSADMNIASTGQLGEFQNTDVITLQSNGNSAAVLGGTGSTGDYNLSQDEFDRIQSGGDFSFFAASASSTDPSLVIDNLTLNTGQIVGQANMVMLTSADSIRVGGNLNLTGADLNTGLTITAAAGDILIATDVGGLVQVTDNGGAFGSVGNLSFIANSIFAMTDQAFADIVGMSVADVDLRLAQNDGIVNADGVIRGGSIALTTTNSSIYIQNTAAGADFDDRRGITAGSLTLFDTVTATPLNIAINGIIGGNTGVDAVAATDITAGFDPASTINGCVIANAASCSSTTPTPTPTPTPAPTPTPTPIPTPTPAPTPAPIDSSPPVIAAGRSAVENLVHDISEEEATNSNTEMVLTMDPAGNSLIQIKEYENLSESGLLDEPVTGAGNDDLWQTTDECQSDANDGCGADSDSKDANELTPAE
ncbi:beta strand repeat-containing protein, partial [Parasphingorhabdus sp.]|uniref:beta strand repeat-containing protein n=1 Tax=Parasphingorhabdus sp. TaxID=2709688 RepID=UPI003C70BC4F